MKWTAEIDGLRVLVVEAPDWWAARAKAAKHFTAKGHRASRGPVRPEDPRLLVTAVARLPVR